MEFLEPPSFRAILRPPPHYFTLVPFSSYNLLTVFVKTCPALLTVHLCQLLNENNNGVFVNISYLDETILSNLVKYIEYVENQTTNIETIENQKNEIETTFFKCNKEICYYI